LRIYITGREFDEVGFIRELGTIRFLIPCMLKNYFDFSIMLLDIHELLIWKQIENRDFSNHFEKIIDGVTMLL